MTDDVEIYPRIGKDYIPRWDLVKKFSLLPDSPLRLFWGGRRESKYNPVVEDQKRIEKLKALP